MHLSSLEDLVRQSEKEGVTLGELLAREASPKQLNRLQAKLQSQIVKGYSKIEEFMGDVSITSVWDLVGLEVPEEGLADSSPLTLSDEG